MFDGVPKIQNSLELLDLAGLVDARRQKNADDVRVSKSFSFGLVAGDPPIARNEYPRPLAAQGANQINVQFTLVTGADWKYDQSLFGLELVDALGRRRRDFRHSLFPSVPRAGLNGDLAWFAAMPSAGVPAGLPWAAFAVNGRNQWDGNAWFQNMEKADLAGTLTLMRYQRLRTELPFEFNDLPLP